MGKRKHPLTFGLTFTGQSAHSARLLVKWAGSDIEAITQEFEVQNPDVDVQLDFVTYEALHDKIITSAASGAGGYDVVLMDCIWPAEFASADFILDVTDRIAEDVKADIWPGALEAVM